jgi:hypothetical protein
MGLPLPGKAIHCTGCASFFARRAWHPQGVLLLWTDLRSRSRVVAPLVGARSQSNTFEHNPLHRFLVADQLLLQRSSSVYL